MKHPERFESLQVLLVRLSEEPDHEEHVTQVKEMRNLHDLAQKPVGYGK